MAVFPHAKPIAPTHRLMGFAIAQPILLKWLHRRRHPVRYAQLEQLLCNQTLSREQMLARQQRDLADMLAYAAAKTKKSRALSAA